VRLIRMHAAQIAGVMLAGIGVSLSVFSLRFLTTCSGLLVSCDLNFHWPSLAPGLDLQIAGVGITLRSGRKNPASQTSEPS